MKTIFITITRGLVVRNILRNKAFEILKQQKDLRIVLLFLNIYNLEPPEYLREELGGDNVIFELIPNWTPGKLQRVFKAATDYLVFAKNSKFYITGVPEQHKRASEFYFFFFNIIYRPLSKFKFLKRLARKIDLLIYKNRRIAHFFDKYSPDLVFSTAIQSGMDYDILKEAKKRKIKTISMPKSWDNLERLLFRVEPDIFLVQNRTMKDQAVEYQAIDEKKIMITGFPQFDIYKESVLMAKEAYCANRGLNPELPILFLGSEGPWSASDDKIFEEIISCREEGMIKNCNIVIRPHFSAAFLNAYERFRECKNVYVDDDFRKSEFFCDKWDPTRNDQINLTNLLYHCSVLVTFASTLSLDIACFRKPTIAVAYGVNFKDGKDISKKMYESDHYEEVMKTGAIITVDSKDELVKVVNESLENPHLRQEDVERLRESMCGAVDGKSGERIAAAILDCLYNRI